MSTSTEPVKTTMKAIRIQPKSRLKTSTFATSSSSTSSTTKITTTTGNETEEDQPLEYSVSNPATASDLGIDTIPIPQPTNDDEILVRVHASTIIKDTLTWPEMNEHRYAIPGHDFAGTVVKVGVSTSTDNGKDDDSKKNSTSFRPGDHVYGMVDATRGECWAEYVVVKTGECALKPVGLTWEQAASVPLSALTAWQALFVKGGVNVERLDWLTREGEIDASGKNKEKSTSNDSKEPPRRVLITGASGGVGIWLVQLAKLAGCYVECGTGSRARSQELLLSLGGDEVVQYDELIQDKQYESSFDTIIDVLGGSVLEQCWKNVKRDGYLVSIDSFSFEFVKEHHDLKAASGDVDRDKNVKACFFIVEPSDQQLRQISKVMEQGKLQTFVGESFPLADATAAYEFCHGSSRGGGKVILVM